MTLHTTLTKNSHVKETPILGDWGKKPKFVLFVNELANTYFRYMIEKWKERIDATGKDDSHIVIHFYNSPLTKQKQKISKKYLAYGFLNHNSCMKLLYPGESFRHLNKSEKQSLKNTFFPLLAKKTHRKLKIKLQHLKAHFLKLIDYKISLTVPSKLRNNFCPNIKVSLSFASKKIYNSKFINNVKEKANEILKMKHLKKIPKLSKKKSRKRQIDMFFNSTEPYETTTNDSALMDDSRSEETVSNFSSPKLMQKKETSDVESSSYSYTEDSSSSEIGTLSLNPRQSKSLIDFSDDENSSKGS